MIDETAAAESCTEGRPLDGIVVVSLALNVPGPVAAHRLGLLGARVTKIEPRSGDQLERLAPDWYADLHAGQTVVRLDLRDAGDIARLDEIVSMADLLITSQRRRVIERLALTSDRLRARHPRLCHVAIVGHPLTERDAPGHDLTYLAPVGLLAPPAMPRTLLADLAAAERVSQLALALLLERERFGRCGEREVALADVARDLAAPLRHGLTDERGPLGGGSPAYGIYRARESWVAVGALEAHFQERLRGLLEIPRLERTDLEAVLRTRSAHEWADWARQNDLPLEEISTRSPIEPL